MGTLAAAIGRAVQAAREQKGLSRAALAEQTYISLEEVAAAEGGSSLLSTGKLERVAGVLGLEPLQLFKGEAVFKPDIALFFRHGSTPDFFDEDLGQLRSAVEGGLALLDVSQVLRRPPGLRARFAPEPPGDTPYERGYAAAQRVRTAIGDDAGPLVDLRALIEDRFDVVVVAAGLRTRGAFAVTVKEPSRGGAAIVLNAAKVDPRRQPLVGRVNLAHELAHVLFDSESVIIELSDPSARAAEAAAAEPIEQRARAFAAELLIPRAGLLKHLGRPERATSLKPAARLVDRARAIYLTPVEITVNHLMHRKYLSKDESFRQELIETVAGRKTPLNPLEVPPVAPAEGAPSIALTQRLREAHERVLITDGRVREALGLAPGAPLPWEAGP